MRKEKTRMSEEMAIVARAATDSLSLLSLPSPWVLSIERRRGDVSVSCAVMAAGEGVNLLARAFQMANSILFENKHYWKQIFQRMPFKYVQGWVSNGSNRVA